MRAIEEIYLNSKDPLDDNKILEYLIKSSCSLQSLLLGDYKVLMYHELRTGNKSKTSKTSKALKIRNSLALNELFMTQYKILREKVLNASDEQINFYIKNYSHIDIRKLKDELLHFPEFHNLADFLDLFNQYDMKKTELNRLLNILESNFMGYWRSFGSSTLSFNKNPITEIKHRLYLNLDYASAYLFAADFIKECNKSGIPYKFKIPVEYTQRDDILVIYTDDEFLDDSLEVINKLLGANEDKYTIYNPPVLTGVYNKYIGYGSEPEKDISSFNELRTYFIKECRKTVFNYYHNNKDKEYMLNGKNITLKEINQYCLYLKKETLDILCKDEELLDAVRHNIRQFFQEKDICLENSAYSNSVVNSFMNKEDEPYQPGKTLIKTLNESTKLGN